MSYNLKTLEAAELPLSPVFIDFIARWLDDPKFTDERWFDQISEELTNPAAAMRSKAQARLDRLQTEETAQLAIAAVYRWFHALATGNGQALAELHSRYRFIAIVGLARTGGSYLTGEVFSSLGHSPSEVPAVIAHDGFPDAQPLVQLNGGNAWVSSLLSMSQYLVMIDLYFSAKPSGDVIVIPKKLTKSIYAGGFFNAVLGPKAEYIITIRHPIANFISTYEKSGGLPSDLKFRTRSNIERWIKRDLMSTGVESSSFESMNYFDAFIRHWELYHIWLATSGVTANRPRTVIPFGKERMEQAARRFHSSHGSSRQASAFFSAGTLLDRHPDLLARSEEALDRVEAVWNLVDMPLPRRELQECF